MVRRVGSNTPPIEAPQLYDVSQKLYAQMGQDVNQAASASMQAFSGLNQAYSANAQRQMSLLAEQEERKAAEAKASQQQGGGGGIAQGIGSIINGVVGGIAVQAELKAKQEAAMMAQAEKDRNFQLDVAKFQQQQLTDEQKMRLDEAKFNMQAEGEAYERGMKEQTTYVDAVVNQLSADLEENAFQMTADQGIAYTDSQINQYKEQYREYFDATPGAEVMFNQKVYGVKQNLYRHYGMTYRGEITDQRRLTVENMNQKVSLTFADRWQELAYGAGTWTSEQSQQSLNDIISQSIQVAQQDPAFAAAVKADPGLMGEFYKGLFTQAGEMYGQFSKGNAEINATVQKIDSVNALIGQLGYIDDAQTVSMLQSEMAKLGLPDWQDPRSWATTINQTMQNQAQSIELEQKLVMAVSAGDPMYGIDTPEHRIMANAVKARNVFDAVNNNNGWDKSSMEAYYEAELRSAREKGDKNAEKYWLTNQNFFKEFTQANAQYDELKSSVLNAQQEYAKAVRPADPNTVIKDPVTGAAIRVQIENADGITTMPKATPQEIEALQGRLTDLHGQVGIIENQWAKQGINLRDPSDETYLKSIEQGAAPYRATLEQRLMEQGQTTNQQDLLNKVPPPSTGSPPDNRQSARPVNFSGGRVPNEEVVRGQTGTLPFATTQVPLANAVPFQGGVATASNIGFVPFKGGTVEIVSKPESKGLVLDSTDPRVATMMGGKVVYAGKTQTLGNVVVMQTSGGLAEVYANLDSINVQSDGFVKPGTPIGVAAGRMEFQVWKTDNALASLRMEIPRNEANPVAYLQGMSGFRPTPSGLGTINILEDKPQPVQGTNSNIFMGSNYRIYGNILVDSNGKQRQLTPTEQTAVYPNGMKVANSHVQQRNEEANRSYNQPMSFPNFGTGGERIMNVQGNSMTEIGKNLQAQGFQILSYSPLGRNSRLGKGSGSYHAQDLALDINYDGKGTAEPIKLRPLYDYFRANAERFGIAELIFEDKMYINDHRQKEGKYTKDDHYDHLHIAFKNKTFAKAAQQMMQQRTNNTSPAGFSRMDNFAQIDEPLLKGNATGLNNIRAFADIIAWAEGHGRPVQYNTRLGWKTFDTSKPHSSNDAQGRYQFVPKTWKWLHNGQNPPMTPANQDKAFISLLKKQRPGLYEQVLAGNFDKAFKEATWIWASIKGNNYTYNGKPQGKYDPNTLAEKARLAVKSYTRENPDGGRTLVTNAPLHQVNAPSSTPSAYGKPNPNHNFGYPVLASNSYVRKTIYNVARQTGKPQQMVADIVAAQTKNYSDLKGFDQAAVIRMVGTNRNLRKPNRTPVNAQPQDLIPNRRTSVGRSYTNGNGRKKKEWHWHKRSDCPTCQSLPIFLPHFIYK